MKDESSNRIRVYLLPPSLWGKLQSTSRRRIKQVSIICVSSTTRHLAQSEPVEG